MIGVFQKSCLSRGRSFVVLLVVILAAAVSARAEDNEKPDDWQQRLEMLRSVPYLALTEESVRSRESGVVLHDPERTCGGYFLYNTRSSGEVFLLDIAGREVHRWIYSHFRNGQSAGETHLGDHAVLLENGDLIIISRFLELIRIDWNSRLLWKKELHPHHDVVCAQDGTFYVIVREDRIHRGLKVRFPAIVHLTMDGEEIERWSSWERLEEMRRTFNSDPFLDTYLDSALAGSKLEGSMNSMIEAARKSLHHYYDYFHMNTVNVMPDNETGKRDHRFRPGNLLTCFRNIDQIAVLEKETYRVMWTWGDEELQWPHHPTMLENGHILIFDNGTRRKYSRVLELDPVSETIVWQYRGDPPNSFYSKARGSAQRLPNGNTLICESDRGRTFQVTPQGEMVWRWLNPILHRTARGKTHRETVYRMIHYPAEQVDPLLSGWWWRSQ
jgi:hypothetical protein